MRESSDSIFSAFSDITKRERKITIFLFQNLRMITSCDGKALAALTKASLALSWQVFTAWKHITVSYSYLLIRSLAQESS